MTKPTKSNAIIKEIAKVGLVAVLCVSALLATHSYFVTQQINQATKQCRAHGGEATVNKFFLNSGYSFSCEKKI